MRVRSEVNSDMDNLPSFDRIMENVQANDSTNKESRPLPRFSSIPIPLISQVQQAPQMSQVPYAPILPHYGYVNYPQGFTQSSMIPQQPYAQPPLVPTRTVPAYRFPNPPDLKFNANHEFQRPEFLLNELFRLISSVQDVQQTLDMLRSAYNEMIRLAGASANGSNVGYASQVTLDSLKKLLLSIPTPSLQALGSQGYDQYRRIETLLKAQAFFAGEPPQDDMYRVSNAYQVSPLLTRNRLPAISERATHRAKSKSDTAVLGKNITISPIKRRRSAPKATKEKSPKDKPASPVCCSHCGSKKTPEWRRGPDGDKTLCNACGIFYSKLTRKYCDPSEASKVMRERKSKGLESDRHV